MPGTAPSGTSTSSATGPRRREQRLDGSGASGSRRPETTYRPPSRRSTRRRCPARRGVRSTYAFQRCAPPMRRPSQTSSARATTAERRIHAPLRGAVRPRGTAAQAGLERRARARSNGAGVAVESRERSANRRWIDFERFLERAPQSRRRRCRASTAARIAVGPCFDQHRELPDAKRVERCDAPACRNESWTKSRIAVSMRRHLSASCTPSSIRATCCSRQAGLAVDQEHLLDAVDAAS